MSFSYLFDPNKQFQDRNGVNNVGGFLRVYIDGTDDRATTYKDFNGTLNEADIMLDSDGRAVVIVDDILTFRIEVYERDGALQWTVTQFTARGEGDGGGSSTPVVVDGTANEIDVTERMTAGVKYYTIGLATVVKNTLLGLIASFSNLVGILNSKADKVQGATAGNLAALDASGNLTDSGSKVADFKTKQTPVTDPSASGAGLEFIDSVSQNANGEITPHKKSVQDGTTAQKGVVQLSNAIDSTSVTEAATPKAVKDAYDELNNKIVARAVFLSQAEWAVQSQLPGDPAKVYYVENGTGEDAYTVYVWKESTSTYEEVDESSIDLDGYWHDSPTTTGSGNVVTNITLGNDGVPQVEKGLSAEPAFSVLPIAKGGTGADTIKGALSTLTSETQHYDTLPTDDTLIVHKFGTATAGNGALYTRKLSYLWTYIQNKISSVLGLTASSYGGKAANAGSADTAAAAAGYTNDGTIATALSGKLDTTGDASNTTSTFTKASGDTSTMTSGGKLSAIFTAISSFFASLKALAFKDKASYNDLSSGVQSSLDKADSALQSHQSVTDNNPTLAWGTTSKVGKVGSTDLLVTMPANPASGKEDAFIRSENHSPYVVFEKDISTGLYDGERFEMIGSWSNNIYKIVGRLRFPPSTAEAPLNNCSLIFASYPAKPMYEFYYKTTVIGSSTWLTMALHLLNVGPSVVTVKPKTISMSVKTSFDITGYTQLDSFPTLINMRDASWINSGTFDTNRIADDAITAAKVKDNETLPVNVSGFASQLSHVTSQNEASTWRQIAKLESSDANRVIAQGFVVAVRERVNTAVFYTGTYIVSCTSKGSDCRILQGTRLANSYDMEFVVAVESDSITLYAKSGSYSPYHVTALFGNPTIAIGNALGSKPAGTDVAKTFLLDTSGQVGSPATPIYVDPNGQLKPCTQGATLKSNTATLYIAGYTDNNIPYYNVKDIKNGCVNHVDFSGITNSTCNITFEAPTLATGEEYDYVISLEGYNDNTGISTGADVENCKQVLYYDSVNNLWRGEPLFLQATDWRQICVVRGNTCEWKRVALS